MPYSVLITNESTEDVVGLAMRWIMTNSKGQDRTTRLSFDSFGTNSAARQLIIPAGTQLIATPNGFKQVRPLSGGFIAGQRKSHNAASFGFGRGYGVNVDELDAAERLTAVVDTIIFKDGRVVGEESVLPDRIRAVAASITRLTSHLRNALAEGRDVAAVLRDVISTRSTPSRPSLLDDPGYSLLKEANFLLGLTPEDRLHRLHQLEHLPDPPFFYRVCRPPENSG